VDTAQQNLRSLRGLGLPVESWDALIIYLLREKLDEGTRKDWDISCSSNEFPRLSELFAFLEKRIKD